MLSKHFSSMVTPGSIELNISALPQGIDNYHIDVKLSPCFCALYKKLLADFITVETSQKQQELKNKQSQEEFRESYVDMMTVLINRVKSDLSRQEIILLQFAVYRYVLENTQNTLDNQINTLRAKLTESRSGSSSGKALSIQDQIFWLSKHYNTILYAVNRHFFILLRQAETRQLQTVRRQYLEPEDQVFIDLLFNPLLLTADLDAANFLIERYLLWNKNKDESEFPDINHQVEAIFRDNLPELDFEPLVDRRQKSDQYEVYDDLGGWLPARTCLAHLPTRKIP